MRIYSASGPAMQQNSVLISCLGAMALTLLVSASPTAAGEDLSFIAVGDLRNATIYLQQAATMNPAATPLTEQLLTTGPLPGHS